MRFGFVGPAYTAQSPTADSQRCINLYPERLESGKGKNPEGMYLIGTPGLKLFCNLPVHVDWGQNVQKMFTAFNGRCFAIAGSILWEIFSGGTYAPRAELLSTSERYYAATNGPQVLIVSAGNAWLMDRFGTVMPVSGGENPVQCAAIDGYFITLTGDSRKFQISGLLDGTSWDGLDFALAEGSGDNLAAIFADHRELWAFGKTRIEVFYDSGDPDFPFSRIQGAFIEQGIAAPDSVAKLDNSIMWLGGDERGHGIAWRANGYVPQRISNHGVEAAWEKYPRIDDAIGWAYQDIGHQFYVLHFPSADPNPLVVAGMNETPSYRGATWVYDASTGMWHERAYWNEAVGVYEAHRGRWFAFAFGKHLVGDWKSGAVYEMAADLYDDAGGPKRWMRSAPHISDEMRWIFYSQLQVDLQAGVGLAVGQGSGPKIFLQMSNDGGITWGNELAAGMGKIGETRWRAIWRRLGRSRDRCFRVFGSDPVKTALIDAHLNLSGGNGS